MCITCGGAEVRVSRSSRSEKSSHWKKVHGTIEKEQVKCVRQGVHGQKRVHGRKRVHGTIENGQAELATHSVCIIWGRAEVCASWS